jgi:hypothetical protein
VGTFTIVNGRKTGGNVASYFCTADGRVLHAIAGPVDAETLLLESKWVLEIYKQAKKVGKDTDADFAKFIREAHAERLRKGLKDESEKAEESTRKAAESTRRRRSESAKRVEPAALAEAVHRLLASQALDDIEKVSPKVWEGILKEKLSDAPVSIQGYGR